MPAGALSRLQTGPLANRRDRGGHEKHQHSQPDRRAVDETARRMCGRRHFGLPGTIQRDNVFRGRRRIPNEYKGYRQIKNFSRAFRRGSATVEHLETSGKPHPPSARASTRPVRLPIRFGAAVGAESNELGDIAHDLSFHRARRALCGIRRSLPSASVIGAPSKAA